MAERDGPEVAQEADPIAERLRALLTRERQGSTHGLGHEDRVHEAEQQKAGARIKTRGLGHGL